MLVTGAVYCVTALIFLAINSLSFQENWNTKTKHTMLIIIISCESYFSFVWLQLLAMVWFACHRRIAVSSSSCVRRKVWSPDWGWTGRRSVQSKVDLQEHDRGSQKADRKTRRWRGRTLCVYWNVLCDPFTASDFSLCRLLNWNCYAIGTSYASMELW